MRELERERGRHRDNDKGRQRGTVSEAGWW